MAPGRRHRTHGSRTRRQRLPLRPIGPRNPRRCRSRDTRCRLEDQPWTRRYRQENQEISERTVGWLSGSCLLVRRAAFDSIEGFDSRYFMYMEDVDFGDRMGRAGWHNVFIPGAEVTHAKGHAASRHPETMLPAHHASAYRFQADRHPHWWQAPLRWALKAGLAVRCRIAVRSALRAREREQAG